MRRQHRGFTYLGLLFAIALVGVVLASVGVVWSAERQREREVELLFIGTQFRNAIASYYERSPGRVKRYPSTLDDLVKDNRFLTIRRHVRRIYVDPMTNAAEWGLVRAPEGGIMGVYSTSEAVPIKQAGFVLQHADLNGKQKYADWQFVYRPPKAGS
ncbi:MAG: type II secretion system protein [Rhodocyclaceae bacterium]|nr:type II secretion system protein [Rhodocyclaceae bacterium]